MGVQWYKWNNGDEWYSDCIMNSGEVEKWVAGFSVDEDRREEIRSGSMGDDENNLHTYEVKLKGTYEVKFPKVLAPDDRGSVTTALEEFTQWLEDVCYMASVKVTIE